MATNLFSRPTTLNLEAAQQGVHKEKSTVEKASLQKLTVQNSSASPAQKHKWNIVWRNVIIFLYLHVTTVYGIYLTFTVIKLSTILWMFILSVCGALGITAGAHRLWSHRAYKAKWPMRFILMIFQTIAHQILHFLEETTKDFSILEQYPAVKAIFMKYNTPLPSSASVERLFSYATMTNTSKGNRLSDKNFERRVVLKANLQEKY